MILTIALEQGKKMARTNIPNNGAPTTPQMVRGIWTIACPKNGAIYDRAMVNKPKNKPEN